MRLCCGCGRGCKGPRQLQAPPVPRRRPHNTHLPPHRPPAVAGSEWYYAALRPCVHYVPFWQHSERDVLAVLAGLRDGPGSGATAQRIAANAWAFAAAHLSEEAVYRHWQAVINSYVALYRGPADAAAAAAAKAWAEEVGRRASAVGAEAEAQCWKDKGGQCWYVGRDAARAVVRKARSERDAGGGGGGTG